MRKQENAKRKHGNKARGKGGGTDAKPQAQGRGANGKRDDFNAGKQSRKGKPKHGSKKRKYNGKNRLLPKRSDKAQDRTPKHGNQDGGANTDGTTRTAKPNGKATKGSFFIGGNQHGKDKGNFGAKGKTKGKRYRKETGRIFPYYRRGGGAYFRRMDFNFIHKKENESFLKISLL